MDNAKVLERAKAAFIKARAKPYKAEHEIAYPLGCYNQPPYFDAPWVEKEFRVFFEGFCAALNKDLQQCA